MLNDESIIKGRFGLIKMINEEFNPSSEFELLKQKNIEINNGIKTGYNKYCIIIIRI